MKNIYLVAAALTLVAACGGNSPDVSDAVTPETEVSALDFSESREATGDRGTIVEACQKFETKKVCNCIVDTMDAELDDEQLKSVAAIMGGGTIIPDSIKRLCLLWKDKS